MDQPYRKHHLALLSSLFQASFFFIFTNAFNIITSVRMVGFMVGDVELPHCFRPLAGMFTGSMELVASHPEN